MGSFRLFEFSKQIQTKSPNLNMFCFLRQMFPDTMTQVVKHDCRICHSKVLQTVQPLVSHVQKHQISLENYYKKFILGIDIDEAPPPEPPSASKAPAKSGDFMSWVNQCEYECENSKKYIQEKL